MSTTMLAAGRAAALFCTSLSADDVLTRDRVTLEIRTEVRAHKGVRGCVAEVAYVYGEYPDTAQRRMVWASTAVAELFPAPKRREISWSRS